MNKGPKTPKIFHNGASELATPTAADVARLRAASARPADTSDIPERKPLAASPTVTSGRIRGAIVAESHRRQMTAYAVWKAARARCQTLPQSAVYEFLRGDRQIGLEYIEALLAALELQLIATSAAVSAPTSAQRAGAPVGGVGGAIIGDLAGPQAAEPIRGENVPRRGGRSVAAGVSDPPPPASHRQ